MIGETGIQDVDDRVQAYQGNPQALQQKYQMTQDIFDLIALQKIKSMQQKAKQQMQLQMAKQGGQPGTVAEQVEQEVLDNTKQELQQQQTSRLQAQKARQDQGMQQLVARMGQSATAQPAGLAGMPAPNAAEPKAMAAGGIVAFADGGDTGYDPSNPYHVQDRLEAEREKFKEKYGFDPENTGLTAGIGTRLANAMGGTSEEAIALERYRAMKEGAKTAQEATKRPTPQAAPAAPGAQGAQPAPTDIRMPQRPQGIAALPGGSGGAGVGGIGNLDATMKAAVKQGLTSPEDRTKAAEAERTRALEFIGFSPEDEAKRRQGIATLEDIDKARFDPERMGRESFARMLAGGANQSWAGGIGAGMTRELSRAEDEQYRQQREATAQRNKAFEELIGKTQEIKKEAYGAGQKKEDIMSKDFQQSLASGSAMRNADVQAAVSAMNAAAQRETAAAMREANNFQRLQSALANINKYRESARMKVLEQYPQYGMLAQMDPAKMDKSQKAAFQQMQSQLRQDLEIAMSPFDRQAAALEERLGYSGTTSSGTTGQTGWSAQRVQ